MAPRAYLSQLHRREQILAATAAVFAREGILGLSMVAVANEARVSRRLIYDHFSDLSSLIECFFDDYATRYIAAIDATVDVTEGPSASFIAGFRQLLALPEVERRALHLLVVDTGLRDLDRVRLRFRHLIEERWLDAMPEADAAGRAQLWTLACGLLGLAALVASADITETAAIDIATRLAQSASRKSMDSRSLTPGRGLV